MNSKALLFLAMLLASILLISAEVATKDKFDKKDDKIETDGVDESKYGYYGGRGYGGPWRGGYGGWRGGYGGWRGGYGGGGWRGGYGGWGGGYGGPWRGGYGGGRGGWGGGWPAEHNEAHTDEQPHT